MIRPAAAYLAALALCHVCLADEARVQDAKALQDSHGLHWRSDVLDMKFGDGSEGKRILVLEFAPPNKEKPDSVKVKLSLATPVEGDANANSQGSISTGGFRDVRLDEKDGMRTITITPSLDAVAKPTKKTQRILNRSALAFTYELKDGSLVLKGFSKERPTNWGQLAFIVPDTDITFRTNR